MITKFGFIKTIQIKEPFLGLKLALAITAIFFGVLLINYFFYPSIWLPFIVVAFIQLALDLLSKKPIKRHLSVNFGRAISTSFHWGSGLSFATLALCSLVIMLGQPLAEKVAGSLFGFYLAHMILTLIIDAFTVDGES